MPNWSTIVEVTLAGFALSASPGPSMMYVLSRTLGQNSLAGLVSAVGLAIGGIILALISASGLAVLFAESRPLFATVSMLGALYLLYLAVDMSRGAWIKLKSHSAAEALPAFVPQPLSRIMWQGVFVELLNPKTILFFIAFLPGFVLPDSGTAWLQMAILGMLIPATAVVSDIIVATAGGSMKGLIGKSPITGFVLEITGALILTAIALRVLYGAFA